MRSIIIGFFVSVLMTASGFAETIITANDNAVDSDVVLESSVKEVKSVGHDTAYMVDDVVKYIKDEAETAASGIKSVFNEEGAHAKAQKEGERVVNAAWDTSSTIQFRSYKVSEGLGDLLQAYAADKSASSIDVAAFFKSIEFPQKTVAHYLPEFRSLFVHQTLKNLLAIEDVLAGYQRAQKNLMGRQVEIEVKFIEVNKSTLDELGFNWDFQSNDGDSWKLFDNIYVPSPQDLITDGLRGAASALGGAAGAGTLNIAKTSGSFQWDLEIKALEQSSDSDVLSAPRVVTHNHETAMIRVGEERMIPKSFEVENQSTSPYVQHADWELELMGVQMEVTPEIRHDGLIDLELDAKILDYIGDDRYQITPEYEGYFGPALGKEAGVTEVNASLPYFRVRALETRVTVADGNTIAMGGLIYDKLETFRDKVPVLGSIPWMGRLFRSEGERSVKRNLMIFVTATQVDVHGRRSVDLALEK
jgi:type II secretory pathway component GspD/PulD (secretin)